MHGISDTKEGKTEISQTRVFLKEPEYMDEKLDFSLPQKPTGGPFANKIVVVLLLVLIALGVANLIKDSSSGSSGSPVDTSGLSAGQIKQLAMKLAQRNLHAQAAKVWADYLASANLTPDERAKALFQAGTSLEQAGLYGEAIEHYYRSETVAALEELAQEILYREALEEHLSGKPEIKKLLDEVTRGLLSRQLMNQQLASKINITETDQKRQDVQQAYIKQMMDKYNVVIHTSVLAPSQESPTERNSPGPQK